MDNSFNDAFCSFLEYRLSETLALSSDKRIKWFWCDGIRMPAEDQLLKENIVNTKQIETEALFGSNGQDVYKIVIELGPRSISNIIADLPLDEFVPSSEDVRWISINADNKTIEVSLN